MCRRFSEEERQTIWDIREAGVPVERITRHLGRQPGLQRGLGWDLDPAAEAQHWHRELSEPDQFVRMGLRNKRSRWRSTTRSMCTCTS